MPLRDPRPSLDDSTGEHHAIADRNPPRVGIKFAALTDTGKLRGNNEDHFLVARLSKSMQICKTSLPGEGKTQFSEEEGYLIVVADGMGGARPANAQRPGSRERRGVRPEHAQMVPSPERPRRGRPSGRTSAKPGTCRSNRDRARSEQCRLSRHGDHPDDGFQRCHRPVHCPRRRLAGLPVPRWRTRAVDQRPHVRPGPDRRRLDLARGRQAA